VLDTGMMGVMVPRVETAEQARHAVSCAKYPPLGSRGFGGRGPLTDYEDVPLAQTLHWINENTLVIVQVESGIAIDNLEEIARVPGVDVALIGPNDLSISLGIPGEYRHPVFLEAVDRVFGICLRNGVSPAMHTGDLQAVKAMREKGARFLIYSNETRMLLGAAKAAVRELGGERLASHSSLRQKTGTGETVSDSQPAVSEIQAGAVDSSACTRFLPQADSAGQS